MKRPSRPPATPKDLPPRGPSPSSPSSSEERDSKPTLRVTTDTLVRETLAAIQTLLDQIDDSPQLRELRTKARSYERIAQQWAGVPSSDAQRDATLELVIDLRLKILDLAKLSSRRS